MLLCPVLMSKKAEEDGRRTFYFLHLGLPNSQALETFSHVYEQTPEVPIVVLTGVANETPTFTTVRKGAQHYLPKKQMNSSLLSRLIH